MDLSKVRLEVSSLSPAIVILFPVFISLSLDFLVAKMYRSDSFKPCCYVHLVQLLSQNCHSCRGVDCSRFLSHPADSSKRTNSILSGVLLSLNALCTLRSSQASQATHECAHGRLLGTIAYSKWHEGGHQATETCLTALMIMNIS